MHFKQTMGCINKCEINSGKSHSYISVLWKLISKKLKMFIEKIMQYIHSIRTKCMNDVFDD